MHQLYQENCVSTPNLQVNLKYYSNVFTSEFNLSFHRPKKDFCNFCTKFANSSSSEKADLKFEYDEHHQRKEAIRQQKQRDKDLAKSDQTVVAITFDLQQVLQSPQLNVSSLYYKRKLATYNLTVFSLSDKSVTCYMWHEAIAGRGSSEIATCIQKFSASLPQSVTHLIMYSDTCGGQNRNQHFASMCLQTVWTKVTPPVDGI